MKHPANHITFSRIAVSILLLLTDAFSVSFFILYVYCGISDMADGVIARKTDTASQRGANLDSAADIVFVAVCAVKIFPAIRLSYWVWIWIAVIVLIKLTNLISGFVCHKKSVFLHTVSNKVTGLLLFLLPISMQWIEVRYAAAVVCAAATFAAIQEGHLIRTGESLR